MKTLRALNKWQKVWGHYAAGVYARKQGVPFELFYLVKFGRLPREWR